MGAGAASGVGSGIGGAVGGIAALAMQGQGGGSEYKEAIKIFEKLKTSNFDFRSISAPELRIVGQYMPQLYDAIVPAEAQQIADSPEARSSQVKSLGTMEEIRDHGDTLSDRLGSERTQNQILGASKSANEGVLRNMAARGQLGGGDELQARLGANQGLQNQAANMASQLAEQRALRKISGAQMSGSMAGQIRAGDIGVQGMNADYITRLNEITSQQRTAAAKDNAAAMTGAQAKNTEESQRVADSNKLLKYGADKDNRNTQNDLRGREFEQQYKKAAGLAGAHQMYGQQMDQKNQNQAQAMQGVGAGVGGIAGGAFGF